MGKNAMRVVSVLMGVAGVACLAAAVVLSLSGCAAKAQIDEESPRYVDAQITSGSNLDESSQYVELRVSFDAELEAAGNPADDLEVRLNGEAPDAKTIAVSAEVDGADVVVRLVPTEAAADGTKSSAYFALYDGQLEVAPRDAAGGLAHVRAAGSESNAVLGEPVHATIPAGMELEVVSAAAAGAGPKPSAGSDAEAASPEGGSVTFDVVQFAQLRCCSWTSFGEDLPVVMMHHHEFLRDMPQTCAKRLADTVNVVYGDALAAEADGSRVTVWALDGAVSGPLSAEAVEGVGVAPATSGSSAEALAAAPGAGPQEGAA